MTSQPPATSPTPPGAVRAWWGFGLLAGPAALLLADTLWAYARGWRAQSRLDQLFILLLAVWTAAVAVAAFRGAVRRRWAARAPQLTLLLVASLLGLALAEGLLGPYLRSQAEPHHRRRPGLQIVNRPAPGVMPGIHGESRVQANSLGLRGPEWGPRAEEYRVLCLGGSTTACTYLDDSETWPQRLLDLLAAAGRGRFWVGNAGLPSLATGDHLRFLRESELVGEVDCVVVQPGVNDFIQWLRGPDPAPPLWTRTRLYTLVHLLYAKFSLGGELQVEDAAGAGYTARRARRAAAVVGNTLPPLDAALDQYALRLRAIALECRRRQLRLVYTTQPVSWDAALDESFRRLLWFGTLPDGRYLSVEQLRAGIDQYNDRLRQVCLSDKVEFIDLAELNGRTDVFYDDCHFTELGATEVARRVAPVILAGLPPGTARP